MSKLVITIFFIFWIGVAVFFVSNLTGKNSSTAPLANVNQTNNTNTSNNDVNTLGGQLSLHNSRNDCWLLINGLVYDMTNYIYQHPGGAREIIKYCGQDATSAFASKDKFIPQDHSAFAKSLLNDYLLGPADSALGHSSN